MLITVKGQINLSSNMKVTRELNVVNLMVKSSTIMLGRIMMITFYVRVS